MTPRFLLAAALLAACQITPAPVPPEPDDAATCAAACGRARELACPFAEPTAAGTTCEVVCSDAVASGIVRLDLACLARIARCEDEQACARRP
jgi:hypothetical protein